MPRPPSCISMIITILPNKLQCVAVVTTTSPVTHTEVVDVKRLSINGVNVLSAADIGSDSIIAPVKIASIKPKAITCVVDNRLLILSKNL